MAGRHDATLIVLDLQEIEAGHAHRVARVIQGVAPVVAADDDAAELVVVVERAFQGGQPPANSVVLTRDVGIDDARQRPHPALVLAGDATRHFPADAQTEDEQWDQHHHPKRDEEARAEFHALLGQEMDGPILIYHPPRDSAAHDGGGPRIDERRERGGPGR